MGLYELPFAKIRILREDIAEVFINDGVEMDLEMVDQYHDFLLSHLKAPFSLLVNKVNAYTYSHPAQLKLCTLKEINVISVVAYSRTTVFTTETLSKNPRDEKWNLKIFSNRDDALAWLISEQRRFGNDCSSELCFTGLVSNVADRGGSGVAGEVK